MDLLLFSNPEQGFPDLSILHRRNCRRKHSSACPGSKHNKHGRANAVPPSKEKDGGEKGRSGAPGKLWRSSRGRDQRLPGDYWCMCISLELCCFPAQELSDRMHYPEQLWRAGLGLAISPSPTCLWKGSPASCCPALAPTSLAAFPMQ